MSGGVSIIGIPFDGQSSFLRGCAAGPAAIRGAFACPSGNTFCEAGFDVGSHPAIQDTGDLVAGEGAAGRAAITQRIADLLRTGQRVLSLGGDHSITFPLLQGLACKYPRVHVLHLDAHPDLYEHLDGNPFSHATPLARALEAGLAERLVQVGIRTMNRHQEQQARRYGVEVWPAGQCHPGMNFEFDGPVYLTLDLDVLDPAFAPGVSHREPGGLTTRQVIELIQGLNVELIGADIVELNPSRDWQSMTARVAAKLMKEILAKMAGPPVPEKD
jgi:agmatinase